MTLGIMQPYFFPYLGYFDLINRVDQWIVFDTPQYMRHGWVNRNRILHPRDGWQYVVMPVKKHQQAAPINCIEIADFEASRQKVLGQLAHYRKRAPYFGDTFTLVERCLGRHAVLLAQLNVNTLGEVCRHLGIPWNVRVLSEMNLELGAIEDPGDWALRICERLNAASYLNPPGGAGLFDPSRFARSGIHLMIQPPLDFTYSCRGRTFIPSLSIIDVLMWNPVDRIKAYLDRRKSESPLRRPLSR